MPLRHPSRLTLACAAAWLIGPGTARSESWPDVSVPIRTGVRTPEDAAVVIGNRVYGQLPDAPYADRDADAFSACALPPPPPPLPPPPPPPPPQSRENAHTN